MTPIALHTVVEAVKKNLPVVVARRFPERVLGLEDRIGHELSRVLVLEPVEHPLSVLAGRHDTGQAKLGEVLRDGRRGLVHNVGQVVHRQLFDVPEREDDPHPGGIRQHREDLDGQFHILAVDLPTANRLIRIHTQMLT